MPRQITVCQMTFPWMKMHEFLIWISPRFVPKGPISNKWALVQVMHRRQAIIGTNADPVHDTYMQHKGEMS